jgi:hypothetical protein
MDFIYAFNRLSPTNLDGTPNQDYLERANRYMKRHSSEKPAFLRNHIRPLDEETYTTTTEEVFIESKGRIPYYSFYRRGSGTRQDVYTVSALDIDRIFLARFIERLQTPVAAAEFTHFLQEEQAEIKAYETRKRELEVHIAAAKSLRDKLKRRLTLLEDDNDTDTKKTVDEEEAEKELVAEVKRSYREQKLEVSRLEAQYEKFIITGTDVQKRRSFKKLMRDAGEAWEEVVTQEDIIELVDLFVIKVAVAWVSPQFFELTIYWKDDEWETEQAVCFKGGCPAPHWSEEEDAILREHYPTATSRQLMHLLPLRTLESMKVRAHYKGIRREVWKKECCVRTFCLKDCEQMERYGLTEDELHWKAGSRIVTSWQIVDAGNLGRLPSS